MTSRRNKRPGAGRAAAAALALLFLSPAGCALYRNDRCFIEESRYRVALDLFIESGSIDLVRQQLADFQWRRCEINQALYRLDKEFEIVE